MIHDSGTRQTRITKTNTSLLSLSLVPLTISALQQQTSYRQQALTNAIEHYEYVATDDGTVSVYDMDSNFGLVKMLSTPPTANSNVKGISVSPATRSLYISYGGDGGQYGNGSLLKYGSS